MIYDDEENRAAAALDFALKPPKRRAESFAPSYWSSATFERGLVYFIGSECGPIKIGLSKSPDARLHMLQLSSPSKLTLLAVARGGREKEKFFHMKFAGQRLHGEWFKPSRDLSETIARLVKANQRWYNRTTLSSRAHHELPNEIMVVADGLEPPTLSV